MNRLLLLIGLVGFALVFTAPLQAQELAPGDPPVRVDEQGVMRWTESGEELALFGVNYSTPFAHAYRAHGISRGRSQARHRR